MNRASIIAIRFLAFCMILSCAAGCGPIEETVPEETDPYYNGDADVKYVSVSMYFPSYGTRDEDWTMVNMSGFYLDPLRDRAAIGEMTSDNTFSLRMPVDAYDLYAVPPKITLIEESEEQLITLDQTLQIETEHFTVTNVYIPKLVDEEPQKTVSPSQGGIIVCVNLVSATDQYPDAISLRLDGRGFSRRGVYTTAKDGAEPYIQYKSYYFELPDLKTAVKAVKYGTLSYTKLQTVLTDPEVVYVCDDETIRIHELGK